MDESNPVSELMDGNLDLQYNPIENLPEDLVIFGDLDVSHTRIKYLPKSLWVLGKIYTLDTLVPSDELNMSAAKGFQ